jgi:hypothetical protein
MSKEKIKQEDYIGHGLHKLDSNLIENRPPKIKWGEKYKTWSKDEKITYLETLACSMNQAAYLIQNERNELNKLCAFKDQQIAQLQPAMEQNMDMLQSEITKMNEQKQFYNAEVARLNTLVRELEKNIKESAKS